MSQYPNSPYSTPQPFQYGYAQDPFEQYLAPGRRAGTLMFILGALGLACSLCLGLVMALAPIDKFVAQSGMQLPSSQEIGMSVESFLRVMYGIIAVVSLLFALILIILAFFVRRGSFAATVAAIVVDGLVLLILLINSITAIAQLASAPANALMGIAMIIFLAGGFGLLLVWLIQAIKATAALRDARLQYQQQYAHYQHYQQMYGYGYGYPQQQAPAPQPQGEINEPPANS